METGALGEIDGIMDSSKKQRLSEIKSTIKMFVNVLLSKIVPYSVKVALNISFLIKY